MTVAGAKGHRCRTVRRWTIAALGVQEACPQRGEQAGAGRQALRTSIQVVMSSGCEPSGSCRLMMAATTMSSGLRAHRTYEQTLVTNIQC